MTRKPFIVANWKMNLGVPEQALGFVRDFAKNAFPFEKVEIVLCPPFTALAEVRQALKALPIGVAGQNCHFEDSGAYTGEISAAFLKALGCSHVIIGHSERRQYFGEDDALLSRKLAKALQQNLTPIFCIGETDAQRENNQTFAVITEQLVGGLGKVSKEAMQNVVLAYEPVWAIGTGKTATPAQAQEVHAAIRGWLQKNFDVTIASALRILYGGSVKPSNAKSLMEQTDIDGALVGGASLSPKDFADIVLNSI